MKVIFTFEGFFSSGHMNDLDLERLNSCPRAFPIFIGFQGLSVGSLSHLACRPAIRNCKWAETQNYLSHRCPL